MGLLLFMGKHKQDSINTIDSSETSGYRGPIVPMTDQEREWIRNVINEKRVVRRPIEKPIEIPKEYKSYCDSTIDRRYERLKRQKAFLLPKLKGLAQAIFQFSKKGTDIPKELSQAHANYLLAIRDVQDRIDSITGHSVYNRDPLFRALQEVNND